MVAGYENDRLRHIRLHEQVNELPDANYATLKHFMGHLDKQVLPETAILCFTNALQLAPFTESAAWRRLITCLSVI